MDYYLDTIGEIRKIVLDAAIPPEKERFWFDLSVTIYTSWGRFRIDTDKWGRVGMGYINMTATFGVFDERDRLVTDNPDLIATLSRALSTRQTLPKGAELTPLSPAEVEAEYTLHDIPRETEYSREGSGWVRLDSRELEEAGRMSKANTDGGTVGFFLRTFGAMPDAQGAVAMARERGKVFSQTTRALVADYIRKAWRQFRELTRPGRDDDFTASEFEAAQLATDAAMRNAQTACELCCAALAGIVAAGGDAARLAAGAIADFKCCLTANEPETAIEAAFDAANAAARACFIEARTGAAGQTANAAQLSRIEENTAISAGKVKAAGERGRKYRKMQLEADKPKRERQKAERDKWVAQVRRHTDKGLSARSAARIVAAKDGCPYRESYLADLVGSKHRRRR